MARVSNSRGVSTSTWRISCAKRTISRKQSRGQRIVYVSREWLECGSWGCCSGYELCGCYKCAYFTKIGKRLIERAECESVVRMILDEGCVRCREWASVLFRRTEASDIGAKDAGYCGNCYQNEFRKYREEAEKKMVALKLERSKLEDKRQFCREELVRLFKDRVGVVSEHLESIIECRLQAPARVQRDSVDCDFGDYKNSYSEILNLTNELPPTHLGVIRENERWVYSPTRAKLFDELGLGEYYHLNLDQMKKESIKSWLSSYKISTKEALVRVTEFEFSKYRGEFELPVSFFHMRKVKNRWVYCRNCENELISRGLCKFLRVNDPRICVFDGYGGQYHLPYSSMHY